VVASYVPFSTKLPTSSEMCLAVSSSSMPPRICVIHSFWLSSMTRPKQPARPSEKLRAVVQGV